jgi:hypothetical protein
LRAANRLIYSYRTSGQRWINHEWLAEVIFARLYNLLGPVYLVGFKLLLSMLPVGLLPRGTPKFQQRQAQARGNRPRGFRTGCKNTGPHAKGRSFLWAVCRHGTTRYSFSCPRTANNLSGPAEVVAQRRSGFLARLFTGRHKESGWKA